MTATDPIRETDDEARTLARALLRDATFAALGVIDPATGGPMVTRIAIATTVSGAPLTLISDLSAHAQALKQNNACSLLVGEPGPRGDPLTHPRLTLMCRAHATRQGEPGHTELAARYLALRPKAKLYSGFQDFFHVTFEVTAAHLNGGFARAYRLTPADLAA